MKKLLTITLILFVASTIHANAQCCKKSTSKVKTEKCCSKVNEKAEIQAYYFHATRRCATCQAVETVTEDTLKEYAAEKVSFKSINREEETDNPMVKKYKISGQKLIIVKGDKVVDLTNDAFLNARTNPDKLKAKIKSTIEGLM